MNVNHIIPNEYPELKMLVWNRNPDQAITGEDALDLYESNWKFIDQSNLTEKEAALIRALVNTFGNGVFLV